MTRTFRLTTHLTLPLALYAAPGASHHAGEPGSEIEIDAERCRVFDRFLRGRIRAGDLVELDNDRAAAPTRAAPARAPAPSKE